MGRSGDGITARETSIQVAFTYGGKPYRLTLRRAGVTLPPTPPNLKYAQRLVAEVRQRIRLGAFSMAEFFPELAGVDATSLASYLDGWEKTIRAPILGAP